MSSISHGAAQAAERPSAAFSRRQSARGIADEKGRLMVVMIHDSDIPDGWNAR